MGETRVTRKTAGYGWLPDLPDHRDLLLAAPVGSLPPAVDLGQHCPPVYDQGQLGSCTANAIGAAIQYDEIKQGLPSVMPSRLFVYYNERVIEGTVGTDSGAMIRDGIKSVNQLGVCPESDWPYDLSYYAIQPSNACYLHAADTKAVLYQRVTRDLDHMRACLAGGYPFVFGFSVYASFESGAVARTGVVPMPKHGESLLGGHATLAVGYDDASSRFIVRNSWGTTWGDSGYCTMPYAYLTTRGLASDFWTIRSVS
jgi:C1A family cysteine protease